MGSGGDTSWHTERDTLDVADPDVLLADIRVYLLAVLRLASAPVLPLDWRALANEFSGAIAAYQQAAGDAVRFRARRRTRPRRCRQQLDRLYASIGQGVSPGGGQRSSCCGSPGCWCR